MALLHSHLEQISLSATAIAELPFPSPKLFVNALLGSHDITALIRDTEAHERALFSTDPASKSSHRRATRRGTMFAAEAEKETMISRIYSVKDRRNQSAVAQVLGGDMMEAIRQIARVPPNQSSRKEINLEIFPVVGAKDKIHSLRQRYQDISTSLSGLEERVSDQAEQLERMNHLDAYESDEATQHAQPSTVDVTDEDIQRELDEIAELENRKRVLERRVNGMEKDLEGLLK
ncbi:hypothetical protein LOZ53_001626 [Ophidiomyces ophidiicola]|nr:hypothetical protein LOZ51_004769 [Ophidiomyces ophidiicola]KAI1994859.1 hypothetical protein LOZ53_001626 [Ophidiomyces ophidiicola]